MVKVVAVNGSPDKAKGNTAKLLDELLKGMRDEGASTQVIYVSDIKPRPCIGDMSCWYRTPGACHIQDDMQTVYPMLREADIMVLASPVYIPLPGEMQSFINRLCPLFRPRLTFENGRTKAMVREGMNLRAIALVSTGAWWELDNLEVLDRIARELALKMGVTYLGSVLRPHAFIMRDVQAKAEEVLSATREAGRMMVAEGMVSREILERIAQPLVSEEELRSRWNALEESAGKKKEGE